MGKKKQVKLSEKKALKLKANQEFLQDLVGVKDEDFALSLINSAGNTVGSLYHQNELGIKSVMQSFHDLKPKDSMEARLIGQSVVLFEFAMKCFRQCGNATEFGPAEANANLGIKLMRVHNETIETLNRYKRGGEQKITVNHALLANQAIVNNNYGEGGSLKNRGDTPCTQENAEQKQEPMEICHAETSQWPMEDVECTEEKVLGQRQKKGKRD